jgi:tRNA (guanine26-N2/guanine27-N2)-dimethyltransferase
MSAAASSDGKQPETAETASKTVVAEGLARIEFADDHAVFYNPVQEVNRDLSCAVLRAFSATAAREEDAREAKRQQRKEQEEGQKWQQQQKGEEKSEGQVAAAGRPRRSSQLRVLEALSATGLRAIRYKREIPEVHSVVANDLDPAAVATIRKNVEFNGLSPETDVVPNLGDASIVMLQAKVDQEAAGRPGGSLNWSGTYDVVDIDPYGGCNPFLDGAVQAVRSGGLLMVTSTDMAVLCGNHPEACMAKYGATSIGGKQVHEMALRILLGCIERAANTHQRTIEPLLTLSIDFYARIFVRVHASPVRAKDSGCKQGYVYICSACGSFETQRMMRKITTERGSTKWQSNTNTAPATCEHCGRGAIKMAGPMWLDPTHSPEFLDTLHGHLLDKNTATMPVDLPTATATVTGSTGSAGSTTRPMYNQHKRIFALVSAARDELNDVPLFHDLPGMSNVLHTSTPPLPAVHEAIRAMGERVSASHTSPQALKTTASNAQMWDMMRSWNKVQPSKRAADEEHRNSPAYGILSKEPAAASDFSAATIQRAKLAARAKPSTPKWLPNPTAHWGPKPRAGTRKATEFYAERASEDGKAPVSGKARANQNHRKRRRTAGDAGAGAGAEKDADGDAEME